MERAIFRGKTEEDAKVRRQQVEQVLAIPVVEKPEDVAKAIWDAVQHKRTEVIVGSANMPLVSSRVIPDFLQWVMRRTFKNKDMDYRNSSMKSNQ
jgi:short-subunit dehydrogenase